MFFVKKNIVRKRLSKTIKHTERFPGRRQENRPVYIITKPVMYSFYHVHTHKRADEK